MGNWKNDPDPALNCLGVGAIAVVVGFLILAMIVEALGNDLPIQPPVFEKRTGYKGPGVPGPLEEGDDEEDPRDTPAPVFFGEQIEDTDTLVYVLDRSSSMNSGSTGLSVRTVQAPDGSSRMVEWALPGQQDWSRGGWTGASRWQRAAVETINSISALADNIKFDVIVYDCLSRWCFGRPEQATATNKAKARAWILSNGPGGAWGGTDTGPATALGVGMAGVDKVILLTDGIPECRDPGTNADARARHRRIILTANQRRVPIHVFGIGVTDEPRLFCVGVAADNQGTYTEVK